MDDGICIIITIIHVSTQYISYFLLRLLTGAFAGALPALTVVRTIGLAFPSLPFLARVCRYTTPLPAICMLVFLFVTIHQFTSRYSVIEAICFLAYPIPLLRADLYSEACTLSVSEPPSENANLILKLFGLVVGDSFIPVSL